MQLFARMKPLLIAVIIGLTGTYGFPAAAQQADLRMRGTIEKIDGKSLVLRGKAETLALDSGTAVFVTQPSSLSAIKPGDFVASAAIKEADGKLHSKDLRIFPEALRGLGEGQRPMETPDKIMTNASVSEVVAAPEGQVVKVKYQNGTAELIVGPEVPVSALVASDVSALKPGTNVFILAGKAADGTVTAKRIMAIN